MLGQDLELTGIRHHPLLFFLGFLYLSLDILQRDIELSDPGYEIIVQVRGHVMHSVYAAVASINLRSSIF